MIVVYGFAEDTTDLGATEINLHTDRLGWISRSQTSCSLRVPILSATRPGEPYFASARGKPKTLSVIHQKDGCCAAKEPSACVELQAP